MTTGRIVRLAALATALACAGCVDRRFVIESNVPNAQVYIDNRPIGAAPAHARFDYYGHYTVTLVHPGYETVTRRVHVRSPWYGYPPFDFLAEVFWPSHIEDVRRYYFEMHEATKTRTDDLINNAEGLRLRGWNLPAPERPALPRGQTTTLPPGQSPPQVLPEPQPLQPFPQPGSAGILPPAGPAPGVVPRVGP